jgi:putative membrane protein
MLFIAALGTASTVATAQQSTTMPNDRTTDSMHPSDSTRERMDDHDRMGDHKAGKVSAAEFAKKAGAAGAAEVEMGKLGAARATDPEVKAYAQKIVADHTKANKELMAAAKSKNLEVPTEPDLMHKGMMKKFEHQKADTDFNQDYMQEMVRDHKKDIALFESVANDSTADPELRALAKKTLPTLEAHLADAQKLEAKFEK